GEAGGQHAQDGAGPEREPPGRPHLPPPCTRSNVKVSPPPTASAPPPTSRMLAAVMYCAIAFCSAMASASVAQSRDAPEQGLRLLVARTFPTVASASDVTTATVPADHSAAPVPSTAALERRPPPGRRVRTPP